MFLLAQEKSDTIEFLKSELVQLLSNMRQEIAASRQSQTGAACHHIEYCMDKIQRAKSSVAIALPIESLNLEITTMLRQSCHQRLEKIGTRLKSWISNTAT